MDLHEIASMLAGPENRVRMRRGVVQSSPSAGRVDITLAGDTTVITGVRYMKECNPVSGETVWVMTDGRDLFVLGALAPLT